MSWLARLQRTTRAEDAREHARFELWESEGGSLRASATSATAPTSLRHARKL
jgi:hypothetical protein